MQDEFERPELGTHGVRDRAEVHQRCFTGDGEYRSRNRGMQTGWAVAGLGTNMVVAGAQDDYYEKNDADQQNVATRNRSHSPHYTDIAQKEQLSRERCRKTP